MPYVTPKQAAEISGFHVKTLAKWASEGKIQHILAESGHRRYDLNSLHRLMGKDNRVTILYARVSTHSQKEGEEL